MSTKPTFSVSIFVRNSEVLIKVRIPVESGDHAMEPRGVADTLRSTNGPKPLRPLWDTE